MAKTQITITEENEKALDKLNVVMAINGNRCKNKELLINKAIELCWSLMDDLDEPSLKSLTGLKKTF